MQVFLELALITYKSDTHVERDGTSVARYNSEAEFIHVPSSLSERTSFGSAAELRPDSTVNTLYLPRGFVYVFQPTCPGR